MSGPYFSETLKSLVGYFIGIFSNDGTFIKGTLADVKKDHLVLRNEKSGYFYHHIDQIKSISKNAKDLRKSKIQPDYLKVEALQEILEQCKYSFVTISCQNDQLTTGFLSRVFEDHLILISGEEKIIVKTDYIISVFPGFYKRTVSIEKADHTEGISYKKMKAKKHENEASPAAEVIENNSAAVLNNETEKTKTVDVERPVHENEEKDKISDKKSLKASRMKEKKESNNSSSPGKELRENAEVREKHSSAFGGTDSEGFSSQNITHHSAEDVSPKKRRVKSSRNIKKITLSKLKKTPADSQEKQLAEKTPPQDEEFKDLVMTLEESEKLLEAQYYSLMKQAKAKYLKDAQYYSLMKQAEANYLNIINKRLSRKN